MKREYSAPEFEYKRIAFIKDALRASDPESQEVTQSGDPDIPPVDPGDPSFDF